MRLYLTTVSFVSLAAILTGSGVLVYNLVELFVPWFAIDTWQYREVVKGTGGNLDLSSPAVREVLASEHMESMKAALKAGIAVVIGGVTFALHFRALRKVTERE